MVKLGWGVYQQVAAVLAAFSLAALLGHFLDIGWRGILESLVGYWDAYVRPAVKWLSGVLIERPLTWAFGWHFEMPLLARDYLSAGFVLTLSLLRQLKSFGTIGDAL